MFAQVMQGRVKDAGRLRAQFDRWDREIKPSAIGFLGATAGITEDGTFITVARFESPEVAAANSGRAEQDAWWQETATCFDGPVTFHDCTKVELSMGGGSDDAGFVQIIQGRVDPGDADRAAEIGRQMDTRVPDVRQDIIGGLSAEHGDGSFTSVNYFTSEDEARKGESQDYPDDVRALFDEWRKIVKDIRFLDLKEPWLTSP